MLQTKIWAAVRKVSSKPAISSSRCIFISNEPYCNTSKIADQFAEFYSNISNDDFLDKYFTQCKSINELAIDFNDNSNQTYNSEFSTHKLTMVLQNAKNSAPGSDNIHVHIEFLKKRFRQYIKNSSSNL